MSENEDEYDDLPSISVNSSTRDSSVLSMPSAGELASQRAREEETERELLLLRTQHECDPTIRLAHSDSSGSEGEVSLAAAVTALQVRGGEGSRGEGATLDAADLLAPLLPRLDPHDDFLADFLHAIEHADPDAATQLAEQVLGSIASAVMGGCSSWSAGEVVSVGAWLCCACVWRAPRVRRGAARRALHALLPQVDAAPRAALATALRAAPLRARLLMSDAARAGTGTGADTLADMLLTTVLTDLCTPVEAQVETQVEVEAQAGVEVSSCVSSGWARLEAAARYLVVTAAGRALAAAPAGSASRRRLLHALAHPRPHHHTAPAATTTLDTRHPDHLKVLVGVSKLQLLFRADK